MSNVPGIVPNIKNNLVSAGAPPARAVAIIGHRDTADGAFPATTLFYDGTIKGVIYNFQSLGDWITLLGLKTTADDFVDGVQDDGGSTAAITPHSPKDSLLYTLALAYLANPSLNVYAGVLDGSGANGFVANDTTTLTTGATDALTDLFLYDDIGYVVCAGFDPVAAGKSHAETATNSTSPAYNMPRVYVAGLDLFKVFDGVTYAGAGAPLDATNDLANVGGAWLTAKSDFGLSMNYIGNHDYDFSVIGDSSGSKQIGGQLAAAYVAGFLATQKESAGVTFSANALGSTRFTPSFSDGTSIPYPFSLTEINEAIGDGWLITRFAQNTFVFAKGINYISAAGTSWLLYPHRSITNFVHKSLADNLQQFLGRQQTQANLAAAQKLCEGILGDAVSRSYISDISSVRVKPHPTEVDAIVAEVEFITIKPINKIYLNITVS